MATRAIQPLLSINWWLGDNEGPSSEARIERSRVQLLAGSFAVR